MTYAHAESADADATTALDKAKAGMATTIVGVYSKIGATELTKVASFALSTGALELTAAAAAIVAVSMF